MILILDLAPRNEIRNALEDKKLSNCYSLFSKLIGLKSRQKWNITKLQILKARQRKNTEYTGVNILPNVPIRYWGTIIWLQGRKFFYVS